MKFFEASRTSFAFLTSASGSCSHWACWPCTAWAGTSPRRASTPQQLAGVLQRRTRDRSSGFFDLFAGGNIRRLTIFALGIMPYITASIILQLLTVVVRRWKSCRRKANWAARKITQWTRYLTVILSVVQSFGIAVSLQSSRELRHQSRASASSC